MLTFNLKKLGISCLQPFKTCICLLTPLNRLHNPLSIGVIGSYLIFTGLDCCFNTGGWVGYELDVLVESCCFGVKGWLPYEHFGIFLGDVWRGLLDDDAEVAG